jgi:hypothetical protein
MEKMVDAIQIDADDEPVKWLEAADSLLKMRFYHGTSRFNLSDNWICFMLGEFIWDDLRMIVLPNHLMKHEMVVCNQMNVVFQSLLRQKGFEYRSVGLNHHLVTEVYYNHSWHVFDADYEPDLTGRSSMEELISSGLFRAIYEKTTGKFFNPHFNELLNTKEITYFPVNSRLATNLTQFQLVAQWMSSFGWTIFLGIGLLLRYL